ncbi:MAG: serine hydrolase, partial [Pyrinomonadaceae bacterium]
MRIIKPIFIATLLFSLANISPAQFGTKQITFKPDVFDQNLTAAVAPNVMAYQYVLIKDGKIVTEGANGQARTAADNGGKVLTMTTSTPQNIGSLAKFLSGTAMLNLMEKPAYASPDAGKTLQQRLDRPFLSIAPTVWSTKAKAGAKSITFRQLLQHRSGFPNAYQKNRNYLGFLQDGFDPSRLGVRDYNNINFAFNGYLIALYDDPPMAAQFDNNISYQKMNEVDGDTYVRGVMGKIMHQLMKDRIWDKMTPKILPTCDSKKDLKTTGAYGYASKSAMSGGVMDSMIEQQGHCGGHGGYFMSARDFANYVAHFSST